MVTCILDKFASFLSEEAEKLNRKRQKVYIAKYESNKLMV